MTGRRSGGDLSSTVATPRVLREYALIADGERGAIIGPAGDLAWLCVPRWDSDAVFNTLIGGAGHYTVGPREQQVWGGFYEDASLIWRSRWITHSGRVECREALSFPVDTHTTTVLRRIQPLDGTAHMRVTLDPRGGYGTTPMTDLHRHREVWTARVGSLYLRWSGAGAARRRADGGVTYLSLDLDLNAGTSHDLLLEISDQSFTADPPDADALWSGTEATWHREVPRLDHVLDARSVRHHYAVLRGLTSPGGGMVAAATTSLPERAEAGRNYDYRYVWIRDQCYTGEAIAALGGHPLLDEAVTFVTGRLREHGDRLAPAYTTTGAPVPSQRHLDLPGYPGGYDIVGNWVNQQFQLDAYGEALLLFASAARLDRLDRGSWDAAQIAATAIAERWQEPDAGIWELDNQPWTHSRLTAAAGLKAIAAVAPPSTRTGDWLALADKITAETTAASLHPGGHWQRSPDDEGLDAALLIPGLRGAIPIDDPRTTATLRAYLRELTSDGYAYRFRHNPRPLYEAEGSFLLCGFLTALALHHHGEPVEARAWYERTHSACGPAQLFSEEYDPHQHQMRGNVPQAFVHALAVEAAATLTGDLSSVS